MESKIEDWLEDNSRKLGLEEPEIVDRDSGEGNHNLILLDKEEKLVLRVSKDTSESRLKKEKDVLQFLEEEGIENIPQVRHFERDDKLGDVLLETYVGEQDLDVDEFAEERLRNLAEQLAEIHSIPVERYNEFTGAEEPSREKLAEVYRSDFREWSKAPYKEYLMQADSPRKQILNFFEQQKEMIQKSDLDVEVRKSLTHGDLGFNVRASGDEIFLVDWEFSCIGYPGNEIMYFFIHEGLEEWQREVFLEEYRSHRELEGFEKTKEVYPKFLAFNDMIWAANRVEKGEEKHRELLGEMLGKLENFYQ